MAATLKSESFFSMSRDVYSSVSCETPSAATGGSSSSDTGGSCVSAGRSTNSTFCRSASARSERSMRATGVSMRTGSGSSSRMRRFTCTCSSRSVAATSPMRRSRRATTASTSRCADHSSAKPMRSKIVSHDQPLHSRSTG
ncbi:MAG: hypothetical protein ABS56_06745 [Lautropia sp. SCN 69-89]|nr:MAG: hypothetical protein ABS56_06745 [Lautropia sp. SCN 69-89]